MAIAVGRVRNLAFYPVKSCGGVEVTSASLTPTGIEVSSYRDHQYMVVRSEKRDGYHDFVTQRDKRGLRDSQQWFSRMALVKPEFAGKRLRLTWNNSDPIELPAYSSGPEIPIRIWDYSGKAVDCGDALATWFSQHLEFPVRLVSAMDSFDRVKESSYAGKSFPLHFQDGYPIHWFTAESLYELSTRAGEQIPWQSFRPQIVVEGLPAQYEHRVSKGNIIGVPFENPKPCDRCPITLVNPETGAVRNNGQPLRALQGYKRWKNLKGQKKVIFGENMLPLSTSYIYVRDPIEITELRNPPLLYGAAV